MTVGHQSLINLAKAQRKGKTWLLISRGSVLVGVIALNKRFLLPIAAINLDTSACNDLHGSCLMLEVAWSNNH